MARSILLGAMLTGVFCALFAVAVDVLTDMLNRTPVVVLSFISGFCGSLFAQLVLQQGGRRP